MIKQTDFFAKYKIDKEKFEESGLQWNELVKIVTDYSRRALKKSPFEIDLSRKWGKLGQKVAILLASSQNHANFSGKVGR